MARTRMPAQLIKYWSKGGPGGAKIGWGRAGDYQKCIVAIQAEASKDGKPLPDNVIHGLCATLHRLNTGATPGNAPGEKR